MTADVAPDASARISHERARAYWICQVLGWGLNGLGQAYSASENLGTPVTAIVLEVIAVNVLALAMTDWLRSFVRFHRWNALQLRALLPRMLLASVLLSSPLAGLMHFMGIADLWNPATLNREALRETLSGLDWLLQIDPAVLRAVNWSAIFFIWIVLYFSLTSLRDRRLAELRQSELIRALQLAELRLLKSQLNPHFLFNSLNSVRALIADNPAGAQNAVTRLARTLRYTLNAGQEELVTLDRELAIVADYLELESLRLGERLRIERSIAPEAQSLPIPVMLLQTLVENAIKHGIAELPDGGVLHIRATVHNDALSIEVENPRPAVSHATASQGVGLHNAAERLRLLFGRSATLNLDLSRADVAVASVRIPRGA